MHFINYSIREIHQKQNGFNVRCRSCQILQRTKEGYNIDMELLLEDNNCYIYGKNNQLDIHLAVVIMIAAVIGGLIGASCAQYIPDATLKRLFGVFMMVVGLQMLFSK